MARWLASWLAWRLVGRPALLRRLQLRLPALGPDPLGLAAALGVLILLLQGLSNRDRPSDRKVRGLESFFNFVFPPHFSGLNNLENWTSSRHVRTPIIAGENFWHVTGSAAAGCDCRARKVRGAKVVAVPTWSWPGLSRPS